MSLKPLIKLALIDNSLRLVTVDKVGHHSDLDLVALRANLELREKGWLTRSMDCWDKPAFAIYKANEPIAFMAYKDLDWDGTMTINLSWTHPDWRGKGLNAILWDSLLEKAKANPNVWAIDSGYHTENAASKAMQKKRGSKPNIITTRFLVKRAD